MSGQFRARRTFMRLERWVCTTTTARHVCQIIIARLGRPCYLHAVLSLRLQYRLSYSSRAPVSAVCAAPARLWRHQHVIDHVRVTSTLFPPRRPRFLLVFSTAAVTAAAAAWPAVDAGLPVSRLDSSHIALAQ